MQNNQITEGIIMRVTPYGDTHKIGNILTRDSGKITVFFHHARTSKHRFSGGVQSFYHLRFTIKKSQKNSDYSNISDYQLLNAFFEIGEDYHSLTMASYFSDLLLHVSKENLNDPLLFELLRSAFLYLCQSEVQKYYLFHIRLYFELRLLQLTGFLPNFHHCFYCQKTPALLSYHHELLCEECIKLHPEIYGISFDDTMRNTILFFVTNRFSQFMSSNDLLKKAHIENIQSVNDILLESILSAPLKSKELLLK